MHQASLARNPSGHLPPVPDFGGHHSMNIDSPINCHAMQPGDLLAIRKTGNRVVRCLEGNVLISLQGCPTDFSLAAGMELVIDHNPLVLIESCGHARIALSPPKDTIHRGWLLLGLLLLALGIASSFADVAPAADSGAIPQASVSAMACHPADRAARAHAWRAGKGMLAADGTVATNRVISAYERECNESS